MNKLWKNIEKKAKFGPLSTPFAPNFGGVLVPIALLKFGT